MNKLAFLIGLVFVLSCQDKVVVKDVVKAVPVTVTIDRFDKKFAGLKTQADFEVLKKAYPYMFSEIYDDAFWIEQMQDSLQQQISEAVNVKFPDLNSQLPEIELLFKHLKYYFNQFKSPKIIITTSFFDYRNRVIVTDSLALISIDNYLGTDHEFYSNFPRYIKKSLNPELIVVDLASAYAAFFTPPQVRRNFLQELIYQGKLLYFNDVVLPFESEANRIRYSDEQLKWAKANEAYVWRYFIDRELLYNTDPDLITRFVSPAPFSKFYLQGIDNESPGQIGAFIGWQIVRSYAETTGASLKEILSTDPETLFKNAKYKPKK